MTSFTPGPNNIMSMTNANRFGLRKTMKFNVGVAAGFFLIMLLCTYLSLVLSGMLPRFRLVMSVVGAGYMLYLAAKVVWSTDAARADRDEALNSFWAGLGLQFLNPKAIMYGITVAANFVLPYSHSQALLLLMAVLLAFVALASTTSWSLFGVIFQRLLTSHRRPFNVAMGLLLVYCAVSVFQ
ncbi:MAG TPA: LysE family transporter [Symbiobacteriaceae bacterium]